MISKIISKKLTAANSVVNIIAAVVANSNRHSLQAELTKRCKRSSDSSPIGFLMLLSDHEMSACIICIKAWRLRKSNFNTFIVHYL